MIKAQILTPITGIGTRSNPRRPAVAATFNLAEWRQLSEENGNVVIETTLPEETLEAIKADATYGPASILSEEPPI